MSKRLPSSSKLTLLACMLVIGLLMAVIFYCNFRGRTSAAPTGGVRDSARINTATGPAPAMDVPLDREAFGRDFDFLTATPHRLAGYQDGSLRAADYVQRRLRELGFGAESLFIQDFPVVQTITTQCRLFVDDQEVNRPDGTPAIRPLRPNLLQASITPAEGISGQTLYAGKGTVPEFSVLPKDRIVVLEWDCDREWLKAFSLGARAVIFVGSQEPAANAYHHVNIPANLPRFYVSEAMADALGLRSGSRNVRIEAAASWQTMQGRNVVAVIRGTNPDFLSGKSQAMVLAAPLDSYGEVPDLSPGAREAANCAALLQVAGKLAQNPPRRDVIICFFDAQAVNHGGASAFYSSIFRRHPKGNSAKWSLTDRRQRYLDEQAYTQHLIDIVGQGANMEACQRLFAPQTAAMPHYDDAMRWLRLQARLMSCDVSERLTTLRLKRNEFEQIARRQADQALDGQPTTSDPAASQAPQAMLDEIAHLDALSRNWSQIQRVLHHRRLDEKFFGSAKEPAPAELALTASLGNPAAPAAEIQGVPDLLEALLVQARLALRGRMAELDQSLRQLDQDQAIQAAMGPEQNTIVLHLSMDLSDSRPNWSIVHGDGSEACYSDLSTNYTSVLKNLSTAIKAMPTQPACFSLFPLQQIHNTGLFGPATHTHSGAIARLFGLYNLSLYTVMDPLPRQGQPQDTPDALAKDVLLAQADGVPAAMAAMASDERTGFAQQTPGVFFDEDTWTGSKAAGPSVMRIGAGSAMADLPVPGAVVALLTFKDFSSTNVDRKPPGFNTAYLTATDSNGTFRAGPYSPKNYKECMVLAASFDKPKPGQISRGLITNITSTRSGITGGGAPLVNKAFIQIAVRSKTVVGFGFDRGSIKTIVMPDTSSAAMRDDRFLLCEVDNVLSIFFAKEIAGFKLFNKSGTVLLNNGADKSGVSQQEGKGYSLEDPFEHPVTPLLGARDIEALNKSRLDTLRVNRINQDSLESLDEEASHLCNDVAKFDDNGAAVNSPAGGSIDGAIGAAAASTAISRRAYIPLVSVMKDLVTAVVLLLLLAIPFAFALERLLVGTPHIYRQIGWFAVFFLATFGILFVVNPAFGIASTPVIIFLAFAIILLSSLVIFIMIGKLQSEVKKMQGLATTVHSTDVSRLSTMMAAVNMGISTMRRRPLRTLLTATTVVLLTFTILTFASFGSTWGTRRTYQGPMVGSTPRILIRHQLWNTIGDGINDTLRGALTNKALVVPRYWVSPTPADCLGLGKFSANPDFLACDDLGTNFVAISAAIALDTRDLQHEKELAALLTGDTTLLESDGVFFTEGVAASLNLTAADVGKTKVVLGRQLLTFAGTISDSLAAHRLLDGSDVRPVDYLGGGGISSVPGENGMAPSETPDIESAQFITFSVHKVAIVSPRTAVAMKGNIRSITLYPNNADDIEGLAQQAATISELPTYVSDRDGGVYRLLFTSLTEASGVKELMIPVLLGGLIVFATMLGSVSDREREIYTFSSLGLAPPHVASLFFAEASMYAVIGGMGGYLLGQGVARGAAFLGSYLHFSVPTMNYSSTNAIVTVLIVMLTVMISAAYPAIKASRSANPGIQRAWRIPKPQGNLYDMVFPFTVSAYDITGVASFLKEHFDSYSDASLGLFATTHCHIFRQEQSDMLGFRATVALAPFDLGVTQEFALLSQPSDIEGIDEVRIMIRRHSGAQGDWMRANRVFINDLRKQLLIWRSLTTEITDYYRQQTLAAWEQLPRQQVDASSMGGSL